MCTHPANMGHSPLGLLTPDHKLDLAWLEIAKFQLFSYLAHKTKRNDNLISIANSERIDRSTTTNRYLIVKIPPPLKPLTRKTQVYGFLTNPGLAVKIRDPTCRSHQGGRVR